MSLDGIFLYGLCRELSDECRGARVERINQPQRDELVLTLHTDNGQRRLIICANPDSARVHFTRQQRENPVSAPMFCMLLRKHLGGARIFGVFQKGVERALEIRFDAYDEFGDKVQKSLVIEIMGRFSNIIFIDEKGVIIDSIKRVDVTTSSQRLVLPKLLYEAPPPQEKTYPFGHSKEEIFGLLSCERFSLMTAEKALLECFLGLSPIVSREIAFRAKVSGVKLCEAGNDALEGLSKAAYEHFLKAESYDTTAFMLAQKDTHRPAYFSYLPILQYGERFDARGFESFSALLDEFYAARDAADIHARRTARLHKLISNNIDRASKKINIQLAELKDARDREKLKLYGDLITANVYRMKKGDRELVADNFFEEGQPKVSIPLDIRLTPAQNAQKFYKAYRRKKSAESYLSKQTEITREELMYLETVMESLSRADGEAALSQIKEELAAGGYYLDGSLKKKGGKEKRKPPKKQSFAFLEYKSPSGVRILCGKNNLQNDHLTLEWARPEYTWLHAKNIPGAHVVICEPFYETDDETLLFAARVAAANCAASKSPRVEIDYTQIKNVKRAAGKKPGMVYYVKQRTILAEPYKNKT
ncbi:MAG: NFACT family protein [Clostridia bacterium]|nr:NFACT family protein [Clostridia bacterium]